MLWSNKNVIVIPDDIMVVGKKQNHRDHDIAHYNPKREMILQTDACIKGLGACLLQEGKPIYFTNKALTEAKQGYVAIELESLVVARAMEKI